MSVSALSVPGTSVTLPNTPVTVQTPTVRVPATAPTPPPAPKVTPPQVTPPKQVTVPSPVKQVTKPVTNVVKNAVPQTTNTVKKAVPQTVNTVKKAVPQATNPVVKRGGSSGTPPGPGGPVGTIVGSLAGGVGATNGTARSTTGALGGTAGTAGSGAGFTSGSTAAGGLTYFGGPGGPGGSTFGSGPSAGGFGDFGGGSAAGGGGSLAMMLAGASPKQLRSVLDHLEGCLPALPAIDRRVITMRAGVNGAPLTRPQVGARLGLSRQAVRNTERRALNRLQYAAANTGCAANVVGPFDAAGIGNLTPQLIFAGAVPVNGSSASPAGDFGVTRGMFSGEASPLFGLGGGGQGGPAWAIILFTVLFSVSIAALTRELRSSF